MPHGPRPGRVGRYWLSKRPNSDAWCRTWRDAGARQTRRSSLGTADLLEAERRLLEWVTYNEVLDRRERQPRELHFVKLALRYWQHHGQHTKMAPSIRCILAMWTERFPDAVVADLTMARLQAFKRELEVEHSSSYVAKIMRMGRRVLTFAHENGDLDALPPWPKVGETNPQQRRLTAAELARLLAAIEIESIRRFAVLAVSTLARPGAILELTREQCDLTDRLIYLNPEGRRQTKKRRAVVPMCETAAELIEAAEPGLLVHRVGQPVPLSFINQELARAGERSGIAGRPVTGMTFRRTMARELRRRGVESWAVAGIMGHAEQKTTEIYAIFDPAEAGSLVRAMDALWLEMSGAGRHAILPRPQVTTSKAFEKRSTG